MAQTVKVYRRIDPGDRRSRAERPLLLGFAPGLPVFAGKQKPAAGFSGNALRHEITPLLCQHDVSRLAALGLSCGRMGSRQRGYGVCCCESGLSE